MAVQILEVEGSSHRKNVRAGGPNPRASELYVHVRNADYPKLSPSTRDSPGADMA